MTLTANDYVTRLRAILATIPRIGTDVTDGADLANTPGYEVFLKSGRHERTGGNKRRQVTRPLSVRVYFRIVEDASNEAALRIARKAVEEAVDDYVEEIFSHVNLSLNDAGIVTTGDAEDGIGMMPYGSHVYYGFDIDLSISYSRG